MNRKIYSLLAGAMLLSGNQAYAAGFALIEQSVSAMGTAYAGAGSLAEDASTIWFNPAGLMNLCSDQAVVGAHIVVPVVDYDDEGSIAIDGFTIPPPGLPNSFQDLNGNDGRDAGEAALIGNSYFSTRVCDCWAVGLGINSPFGLVTDYDNHWKGRYQAVRSSILTINLNPTIAYRINDCLSVGAGLDFMYLHAKLSNKIDFGLIGLFATGNLVPGLPPFIPQEQDGYVKLKGNSWGYGANIGFLYEFSPCTRFGFSYRSEIKQDIRGSEKFEDLPAVFAIPQLAALAARFEDTRFKAKVTLPSSALFSFYHAFNGCWAIVGDAMWTKWDILNRLRITFRNPNQAEQILPLKWENTWRLSVGAIFTPNCCWTLRAGFAWDQGPTPNKRLRIARLPENDRYWLAFGVGYNWDECVHIDVGYAHLFVPKTKIDQLEDFGSLSTQDRWFLGALNGKYEAYTDIISAQVVFNF